MDPKQVASWIAALEEEEQTLTTRLASVRTARMALASLQPDEPVEFEGKLADACRTVLKNHRGSLSPTEVRDRVRALGYDLSKHEKNEMASIHGVLKRLVESGDVKTKEWKKTPGTRYYWADESIWTSATRPNSIGAIAQIANSLNNPQMEAILRESQKAFESLGGHDKTLEKMAKASEEFQRLVDNNPLTKK